MCSGKNPLAQIVKSLSEYNNRAYKSAQESGTILTKRPKNAKICNNDTNCEVRSCTNEEDYMCRIYSNAQSIFVQPCDSRLIGAYIVHIRHANVRILSKERLTRRAIMIDHGQKALFMGILHAF